MSHTKTIAGVALAGGLAAATLGLGAGVANADPGPHWGPDRGPGWNQGPAGWNQGPGNWGPPPPPPGAGPVPGGWNGGWEPNGQVCVWVFCV